MTDPKSGDALPVRTFEPSAVDLFMFSAASWLLHRIHYDRPYTVEHEGHPELVVHGPLQGVYLVRTVEDWIGARGRLVSISYRHLSAAYLGDELECGGSVASTNEEGVDVELFVRKVGGDVTTTGKGRLQWLT